MSDPEAYETRRLTDGTLDTARTHVRRWRSANGQRAELCVFDQPGASQEPTGLVLMSVEFVENMLARLGYTREDADHG